ncbi:YifB family Mg chelatase-like AAA ATPase [Microbacterium oleivorans]|uniref:YifB family Mg chelatase-like AAA ATPase n=1 Tax=Microbacterium oleivorans TaxID=273677 RepID=A0A7D5EUY7_9MICO|nr:YifB family Mg chelatase-like AAA ATPase [Microbacterium oleivorans]QLD10364.1 YifB family Mg chelatase-like AAA ATPase [Microbacterium oleivorans]
MSVGRTWAVSLTGLVGDLVEVEADLSNQTPAFRIVGLADRALAEAQQRVHNACSNSGLPLSRRRVTVNLSPASLPKQGSGFDLAIAIAALATELPMDAASLAETVHIGELGLDGRLRPVPGVLPAVVAAARAGRRTVIVPERNRAEAELVEGIRVVGCRSLAAVARWHGLDLDVSDDEAESGVVPAPSPERETPAGDLADVRGQEEAVSAVVVAAAGGHHLLMSGPPGAGKTMLARRLPGILPPLDDDTALHVASVRSLSGDPLDRLSRQPPFEAPHHSVSVAALVGGGSRSLRPGAIARASGGVLFLDEAGEFGAHALDSLRQPLESGTIDIHRAGFRASLPARFQLVLATNPCPCGQYGVRGGTCSCPSIAIRRYLGRLSGPLLDRIDIELALNRVSVADLTMAGESGTTSEEARARVAVARRRAAARLAPTPWRTNAEVSGAWLRDGPLAPEPRVRAPLDTALQRGALTLRGYDRVLRVAWSVADLAGNDRLTLSDVGRALFLKKGIEQ